ncbi:ribosome recycling factor domain-containing protein [Rhodocollybia butyracea]|uniref:Ribosome recycling factor domain-containing protein n=1 Tax=Rhodocollybia butyracea TaxID=206335 RepID=A0A9P5PXV5_9AGAR|nr:ribosome recycling factor domain-containing protein [Rhodocollybia butyracea]
MSSILRHAIFRPSTFTFRQRLCINASKTYLPFASLIFTQTYAVKAGKGPKSTANLVPGSQQPITDPAAQEEYKKTESKMAVAVDWFRKECASIETRASGRVTPALLSSVRVQFPKEDQLFKLEEISTVGVRNGSELIITVFEEESLKHVERALYDAKLPNITPQKMDNRALRIPVPKPTVEARNVLFTAAQRQGEDTRVQIRKHHQASLKKGKYEKRSVEVEEFQKLTDRFVAEVDKIVTGLKKAIGTK